MASKNMADLCNVPEYTAQAVNYYSYMFALDNVWFGNSLYDNTGIFVSAPLSLNDLGVLAVNTSSNTETGVVQNSIELEIIKIDRSPKYKITKIPIPYLGQTTVTSERLVLTRRETNAVVYDVGMLRFLPYVASTWDGITPPPDPDPITIYENGTALTTADWEFAIAEEDLASNWSLDWQTGFANATSWTETLTQTGYKLSPPKMWIKIKNPELNAVYTVDYTIRTSDSHTADDNYTIWLDKDQTAWLTNKGRVRFKQEDPDNTVKSDVYLQVTLRRNKSSQALSPELHEYAVLAAVYS